MVSIQQEEIAILPNPSHHHPSSGSNILKAIVDTMTQLKLTKSYGKIIVLDFFQIPHKGAFIEDGCGGVLYMIAWNNVLEAKEDELWEQFYLLNRPYIIISFKNYAVRLEMSEGEHWKDFVVIFMLKHIFIFMYFFF